MIKKIKSKVRSLLLLITGKIGYIKTGVYCKHEWYGNNYGGFYICPEILNSKSIIYSFGIGEDISFDKTVIDKHGCTVYGFDPTPKSINWIKNQKLPVKFKFFEYGISTKNEMVNFYLPKNPNYVSGSIIVHKNIEFMNKVSVPMKCLTEITKKLGHQHIDVLKMDIEGSEYDVIENILNSPVTINQILMEFHYLYFKDGKTKTQNTIKLLKKFGFEVFAVSDSFEEISFINKNALEKV